MSTVTDLCKSKKRSLNISVVILNINLFHIFRLIYYTSHVHCRKFGKETIIKKNFNFNAIVKENYHYIHYVICIYIFIIHPHILKDSDSILTLFYIMLFFT